MSMLNWVDIPTEEKNQGSLTVGEIDGKVFIWVANQIIRLELTVDETFALINALNIQIQRVITRESPDNA